jgi:hypothetical protein
VATSTEPFAKSHNVRCDAGVLESEEFSRSAYPGLDFIKDEKDILALCQSA